MRFYNMSPNALYMKFEALKPSYVSGPHVSKGKKPYKKRNSFGQYAELTECVNEGFENIANGVDPDEAFSRLDIKMEGWRKENNKPLMYKSNYLRKKISKYVKEVLKKR